jgi:periplasmic protein TonB
LFPFAAHRSRLFVSMNAPTVPLNPMTAPLPVPSRRLPPLPRPGERVDGLTPWQRRAMIAGIVAAHAGGVWALLQIDAVRAAVFETAPIFVDLIAPPPPPVPPAPPPPPAPQPILKKPPPPKPVIAAVPSPAPAPFVVPAPPPPEPVEETPAPVVAVAPPAPPTPPPPAPPPKIIPASAVQYLEPLLPVYPRLSIRQQETGRVLVRVFIDEEGRPRDVRISQSSNFARLDDAAVSAVQKVRFKPYTENGRPASGWATIPVDFSLEK